MRLSLSKEITLTKQHNGANCQCKAVHSDPDNTVTSTIKSYSVTCKSVCTNVHLYIYIWMLHTNSSIEGAFGSG